MPDAPAPLKDNSRAPAEKPGLFLFTQAKTLPSRKKERALIPAWKGGLGVFLCGSVSSELERQAGKAQNKEY